MVLDAEGLVLSTLSPVGTLVWDCLPNDATGIMDVLRARFPDVPEDTMREDLERFLVELTTSSLIVEIDAAD